MAYTENQMTHVKIQNSRWETKIFEMEDLCSTDRKCQLFFPEGIYTESSNGKGYADCNSYDDHLFPDEVSHLKQYRNFQSQKHTVSGTTSTRGRI
jgi:hypothetical protein